MNDRLTPTQRPTGTDTGATAGTHPQTKAARWDRPPAARAGRWPAVVSAAIIVGALAGLMLRAHPAAVAAPMQAVPLAGTLVPNAAPTARVVAARPVNAAELAMLPQATTWGVVPKAPRDPDPMAVPDGELVSPSSTVAVYAAPGGAPIAALPARQLDGDRRPVSATAVPVIATMPGWVRVLLPTKPNNATGWVPLANPAVHLSTSPYVIRVDRARYTLTLLRSGRQVGQWRVAVGVLRDVHGVRGSVTPAGRTFVLADIRILHPSYSPVILPLGMHSPIFDSYGGGPATVGIHTWTPDAAVYGTNASHGCIRVPPDALRLISTTVPIGTPVIIA